MVLQILSDLHLESPSPSAYSHFTIHPHAPHLALLGDIGNVIPHQTPLLSFLTRLLTQFSTVLFVPGNHEPYSSTWPAALTILSAFEEKVRSNTALGAFILLDRASYRLPGTDITVLGCSLFSHVPAERELSVEIGLNDFFQIEDWDVKAHNTAHNHDILWLNAAVAELEQQQPKPKIVILTHWSPSTDPRAQDPKHAGSTISSAFATDLSNQICFKSKSVRLWAFGHTHYNCDFLAEREGDAGSLRLYSNQRGYYFAKAEGFDREKSVEI